VSAVEGGDAGGDALASLDGFGESGAETGRVLLGHWGQVQVVRAIFSEGKANESAAESGHEVDGFGSDKFSCEGEVAFVFAILIIDYDQHASGADLVDGGWDIDERRGGNYSLNGSECRV